LKSKVTEIDYSNPNGAIISFTRNGVESKVMAKAVLVTVSLGVLKAGNIKFTPSLPDWKQEVIDGMGFGLLDKCVMQWDNPDAAVWPEEEWIELVTPKGENSGKWTTFFNPTCMYTATTNLIAGSVEKDREEGKDVQKRTTETLITAFRLALLIGVVFGTTLSTFAPKFLSMLIGNDTLDPTVFSSALRYVRIRCLGMPAAVVIGTAQSACLGMKDVRSPLYVLAAAAGINLIGDLLLVGNSNPWLGGASGAAWATVLSQWGAMAMFLKWLTTKAKAKEVSASAGMDIDVESDDVKAPARGVLASKYKPSSILKLSSLRKNKTTNKFLPFLVPVTTTSIGHVSGYLTMSHVASSALGTLDMAAHQIAISIFCCLSPFVDALNTVAQSFVRSIFARPKSKQRALALRKTSLNFAKVGAMAGLLIVTLVTCGVPLLSRLFTTDPRVLSRVKNAIPGIAIFLGFDGLMSIGVLGHKDLAFLRNSYATFFFLVPAFMLRLKRKALKGIPVGLGTMWGTFSAYEVVRTVLWLSRVAYLQWKTESEASKIEEEQGIGSTL
jgi:Na+-driven multidrug efflux pump